jgi:hypothetical protein
MHLSIHSRTLLRGMLAGAVALAGVSACSRSDRADAGRDSTQTGQTGAAPDSTVAAGDTTAAPRQTATPSPRIKSSRQVSVNGSQPVDTSATTPNTPDTTASGYEPMARDTSTALAKGDTTAQGQADSTAQAEADTTTLHAQVDTSAQAQPEVAVKGGADTVTVVGDSAARADTLATRTEPIRPAEDLTEVLGNSDVEAVGDEEAVAAAPVESTGNIVTGAEAVALMSRGGQPCQVVKSEDSSDAQWDLASSPATLNPCGTGTMTLPRVQTGEGE